MTFGIGDVETHQRRHFGAVRCTCKGEPHATTCPRSRVASELPPMPAPKAAKLPQPVRMTRPEREYGRMLEKQKRDGEIVDAIFQGMSLAYSADPETGILLRYKCDWVVIVATGHKTRTEGLAIATIPFAGIKIVEVKGHGPHAISAAAKLRFKGAKAAWPMFQFEMMQRERDGQWRRVL